MSKLDERPRFPRDDEVERRRYFHHLEWSPDGEWQYTSTRAVEADHPAGWTPVAPDGWELNVDRWPTYDEEAAGWVRVGPGVLRNPRAGGAVLVAHWRRKR